MDKKRLITSALPYVNNVPHLGNLIQVLSADVFARFCRSRGYETLYVCGTDEYGTATETRAVIEGVSPQELCTRYHKIHDDIYKWFSIDFDKFGRTSTPEQTKIVQSIFTNLYKSGYVFEKEIQQLYSEKSNMFLADRYVHGICPKCSYDSARGDQCESCGTLLDPLDLINPICVVDNTSPIVKHTKHLYIDLQKLLPKLEKWVQNAKNSGTWSNNAIKMTEAWMRDGLVERGITRDLRWGIPVPYEGYEDKVFYVWFDAPIGYISITATHTKDWKSWWYNPNEVELFQFIGKDNIPFHTVVFPASLLGTGENWTMLHRISSTEFLHYEDGMFSKSKGIGIFGNDVQDTGIPVDAWRFYMLYNRPESSDYLFTWKDFQNAINSELINNFSNLYNRTLAFIVRYFDSKIETIDLSDEETQNIWQSVIEYEKEITVLLEKVEIRQAYLKIFSLSSFANKLLQDYEPWKLRVENPDKAKWILSNLVYIIQELAILVEPYTPNVSKQIAKSLNIELPTWENLMCNNEPKKLQSINSVQKPELLFTRLEDKEIAQLKDKFSGSQSERAERKGANPPTKEHVVQQKESITNSFAKKVCLKVSKIKEVQQHPNADKLYVLQLDDGSNEERTIVSGIKDYYTPEDLIGKNIILVANLKPANLRGIKSNGMLLAASGVSSYDKNKEIVEVLFVEDAPVGSIVIPKGTQASVEYSTLKIDEFFEFSINANKNKVIEIAETPLIIDFVESEIIICSSKIANARVG